MEIVTANEWAESLKGLAHPTRLQIIAELLKGTKCVTDIQDILPASQSNISQHLTVLRHANLVDFAQDGAQRCYYVSRPRLVSGIVALLSEGEPVVRKSREEIHRGNGADAPRSACCMKEDPIRFRSTPPITERSHESP